MTIKHIFKSINLNGYPEKTQIFHGNYFIDISGRLKKIRLLNTIFLRIARQKLFIIMYKYITKNANFISIYTHFFISTWTFRQKPSLSTYCAYFFRRKPSCAMCLIFLKKSLHVLIHCRVMCLFFSTKAFMCLFFSTKAFMCYVLNFFEKKPSCA